MITLKETQKKLSFQIKKKQFDYEYSFLKFLNTILILENKKFKLLDYGGGLGNTVLDIYLKDIFRENLRITLFDLNTDFVDYSKKFLKKN